MSNNTNNYIINPLKLMQYSNDSSKFAIQISFERSFGGITGILISYHLMCALLVITASLNFLIDPKVVPGRAGMLVTLFLVLANFFSDAQVNLTSKLFTKVCTYFMLIFLLPCNFGP